MFTPRLVTGLCLAALLLTGCSTEYPQSCPASPPIGLLDADEIASDDSLSFRFPLDESAIDETFFYGWFGVSNECTPDIKDCYEYPDVLFQSAEDYNRPAGTPVYAMADGHISFSGTAGGYGWLIIIDHPQANLYSLYGHLSPSRWKQASGTDVKRGDLIAYLGDSDENGGSAESPVIPHLHFGIRAGQRDDYPSRGEWRWTAGWIRLCPQDIGWLQPSLVITSQEIPVGGYPQPEIPFWIRWGQEILITSLYTLGGVGMLAGAVRKKARLFLIFPGILVTAAGIVLHNNRMLSTYVLLLIGILMLVFGIFWYARSTGSNLPDKAQ
jgi:murein DD-endopeptidase MepM/ murein hydrolase activator NlpD